MVRNYLYGSHFLSAWGSRMWEFALGLTLLELGSGSLLLVSAFGLLDGCAVTLAGPVAGAFIDRTDRLTAASVMYLVQNSAVSASSAFALAALAVTRNSAVFWIYIALLIGLGSLSSAGALGATLSVEKEWTNALCGDDSGELAMLNAGMRRIDLFCLIASPILVGFLMTYISTQAGILLILAWNLLAWAPELVLLRAAHSRSPALRQRVEQQKVESSQLSNALATMKRGGVALPAISLSLLYLTVLSFGLLTTAYLKWRGMSEAELSVYRGFGAFAGVSATFLFPLLHSRLGLAKSGMLGIWWQLLSLTAAVLPSLLSRPLHLPNAVVTHLLVGGLVFSRVGLWLFDLCVNQIIQEGVNPDELGTVSGLQGSLASLFQSTSYLVGILVPDPQNFDWLMAGSWAVVCTAAFIFTLWAAAGRLSVGLGRGAKEENAVEMQHPSDMEESVPLHKKQAQQDLE